MKKRILLEEGQKLWFTSDTHYAHRNIVKSESEWTDTKNLRNYSSVERMNDEIVDNINSLVSYKDVLFHLGDFAFQSEDRVRELRRRIVCENVHLILGNHDGRIYDSEELRGMFSSVDEYVELEVEFPSGHVHKFVLMHYPLASWKGMGRGVYHLHGHVHLPMNKRLGPGRMIDVGVDGNGMFPIEVTEVIEILETREIKSLIQGDHHQKTEYYK